MSLISAIAFKSFALDLVPYYYNLIFEFKKNLNFHLKYYAHHKMSKQSANLCFTFISSNSSFIDSSIVIKYP